MSYLDDLLQQQQYIQPTGASIGLRKGQAYASFYNPVDVSAPAYIQPNAYTLAQAGYRQNEFAYSIMQIRAMAKSQAVLCVRDYVNDEEVDDHPLTRLLHNPNPAPHMTWALFMQMKQITQDIAGFSAWEIEYANNGEILALWYMTPYFCSFLRGQQQPLRAIRYQPYGLAPMDIPFKDERGRPKILFFSDGENFDPLSDRVRFRSPMMAAFPQVQIDNAMTFFLNDFVKNGAKFAGMISVAQTIDENQAEDYRRRWRQQHGGAENWSDPLILGEGASYSSMQMNFKDMAFPELDARAETRICNAFLIDPIVANARAGLDVSSYNNKKQAQKDWFYNWTIPSWKADADSFGTQMLPIFEATPEDYYCEFDFSDVYALKEDRDAQVKRAVDLYKANVAKLNEARAEIGLDPVDEGDEFAGNAPHITERIDALESALPKPTTDGGLLNQTQNTTPAQPAQQPAQTPPSEADMIAKQDEAKKFRTFAKTRIKEGKAELIPTYEFKRHTLDEQVVLLQEFGIMPVAQKSDAVILAEALVKLAESYK